MLKYAVGFLASAAGIAVVALLLGVLVRLASDTRGSFSIPSAEREHPSHADEVLHQA